MIRLQVRGKKNNKIDIFNARKMVRELFFFFHERPTKKEKNKLSKLSDDSQSNAKLEKMCYGPFFIYV